MKSMRCLILIYISIFIFMLEKNVRAETTLLSSSGAIVNASTEAKGSMTILSFEVKVPITISKSDPIIFTFENPAYTMPTGYAKEIQALDAEENIDNSYYYQCDKGNKEGQYIFYPNHQPGSDPNPLTDHQQLHPDTIYLFSISTSNPIKSVSNGFTVASKNTIAKSDYSFNNNGSISFGVNSEVTLSKSNPLVVTASAGSINVGQGYVWGDNFIAEGCVDVVEQGSNPNEYLIYPTQGQTLKPGIDYSFTMASTGTFKLANLLLASSSSISEPTSNYSNVSSKSKENPGYSDVKLRVGYVQLSGQHSAKLISSEGIQSCNIIVFAFAVMDINGDLKKIGKKYIDQIQYIMDNSADNTIFLYSVGGATVGSKQICVESADGIVQFVMKQINHINSNIKNDKKITGVDLDFEGCINTEAITAYGTKFKQQVIDSKPLILSMAPQVVSTNTNDIDSSNPTNLALSSGFPNGEVSEADAQYNAAINAVGPDYIFVQCYNTGDFTIDGYHEYDTEIFSALTKALTNLSTADPASNPCSIKEGVIKGNTKIAVGLPSNRGAGNSQTIFGKNEEWNLSAPYNQSDILSEIKNQLGILNDTVCGVMTWSLNNDYSPRLYQDDFAVTGGFCNSIFNAVDVDKQEANLPYMTLILNFNDGEEEFKGVEYRNQGAISVTFVINNTWNVFGLPCEDGKQKPLPTSVSKAGWGTLEAVVQKADCSESGELDEICQNPDLSEIKGQILINYYGVDNQDIGNPTIQSQPIDITLHSGKNNMLTILLNKTLPLSTPDSFYSKDPLGDLKKANQPCVVLQKCYPKNSDPSDAEELYSYFKWQDRMTDFGVAGFKPLYDKYGNDIVSGNDPSTSSGQTSQTGTSEIQTGGTSTGDSSISNGTGQVQVSYENSTGGFYTEGNALIFQILSSTYISESNPLVVTLLTGALAVTPPKNEPSNMERIEWDSNENNEDNWIQNWGDSWEQYEVVQGAASNQYFIYPSATKGGSATDKLSYTVKSGDTLFDIAKTYGVSVDALKKLNRITGDNIQVGQTLFFPASGTFLEKGFKYKLSLVTTESPLSIGNVHIGSVVKGNFTITQTYTFDPRGNYDEQPFNKYEITFSFPRGGYTNFGNPVNIEGKKGLIHSAKIKGASWDLNVIPNSAGDKYIKICTPGNMYVEANKPYTMEIETETDDFLINSLWLGDENTISMARNSNKEGYEISNEDANPGKSPLNLRVGYVQLSGQHDAKLIRFPGIQSCNVIVFAFAPLEGEDLPTSPRDFKDEISYIMCNAAKDTKFFYSVGGATYDNTQINKDTVDNIVKSVVSQIEKINAMAKEKCGGRKIVGVDLDLEGGGNAIDAETIKLLTNKFKSTKVNGENLLVSWAPQLVENRTGKVDTDPNGNIDSNKPDNLGLVTGGFNNQYGEVLTSEEPAYPDYIFLQLYNTLGFTVDGFNESQTGIFTAAANAMENYINNIDKNSKIKVAIGLPSNRGAGNADTIFSAYDEYGEWAPYVQSKVLDDIKGQIVNRSWDGVVQGVMTWSLNNDYSPSLYQDGSAKAGAFCQYIYGSNYVPEEDKVPYMTVVLLYEDGGWGEGGVVLSLITDDGTYICLGRPGKIAGTSIPLSGPKVIWNTITANTNPYFDYRNAAMFGISVQENGSLDELAQKAGPNSEIRCKAIVSWYEEDETDLNKPKTQSYTFPLVLYAGSDNLITIGILRNPTGFVSRNNSITGSNDNDRPDGYVKYYMDTENGSTEVKQPWVWSFNHRDGAKELKASLKASTQLVKKIIGLEPIPKAINTGKKVIKQTKDFVTGDTEAIKKDIKGQVKSKAKDGIEYLTK